MTVNPQGTIYLCKTKLKNDYKNQLTFSTPKEQINYFNSTVFKTYTNYTYIKKDNVVQVGENIDNLINCNYLFYLNTGFSTKYYFCFITKMEYVNENCTRIYFETDCFQTWYFELTYNRCFIEREHVDDDSVGVNTVPENLEVGEYISNAHYKDPTMSDFSKKCCFIVASTSEPIVGEAKDTVAPTAIYNGIYTGLSYYRYDDPSAIDLILELFANSGKTDAINGIFMAPQWLAPLSEDTYRSVKQSKIPNSYTLNVTKLTSLNGYTPKNNKLFCFPYNYLLLSNNVGQNTILHYEKFSTSSCGFVVKGVLNPGCSINITPLKYNGNDESVVDSISLGKFPICNFQNDMYTNWLTQNSINVLGQTITTDDVNIVSSALSGIAGAMSLNPNNIFSGLSGIFGSVIEQKQHNMMPPSVVGQLNSGDVNVASDNNTFHFYKMSVKKEYAEIIDNYFSMYGYKVNSLKTPNRIGRKNWNFIKTIGCNITANIPQEDLEIIRNMFNEGVTLWHNPSTMFDYSQPNDIV